MTLLFAEHGYTVHFYDPSQDNVDALLSHAKEAKQRDKIFAQKDYKSLCKALDTSPRVFLFSLPHGNVADKTIDGLDSYL